MRQRQPGINLAFLDIMACGLGAVILVFMLVRTQTGTPGVESQPLEVELAELRAERDALQRTLEALLARAAADQKTAARLGREIQRAEGQLAATRAEVSARQARLAQLKAAIAAAPPAQQDDTLEAVLGGEENYVLGLKVEGRRIVVLIDASASMTDENIIDIIKRKIGNVTHKRKGPKWQRTIRVARWLIERVPKGSEVKVVTYNTAARTVGPPGWLDVHDAGVARALSTALGEVVPEGGTNLGLGLKALQEIGPTNVYLITDGLPTLGVRGYRKLNPFSKCASILGRARKISGACRLRLLEQNIKDHKLRARINVILLPLEGDPVASNAYWQWSSQTGGLMITPALNWP